MLKNDFFFVRSFNHADGHISASIAINAEHAIFGGHFPGQPVVPGVCMMQIVKELVEEATHQPYFLHKAGNIKFLTVMVPAGELLVSASIHYKPLDTGSIQFEAVLSNQDTTYFKFNGEYIKEFSQDA